MNRLNLLLLSGFCLLLSKWFVKDNAISCGWLLSSGLREDGTIVDECRSRVVATTPIKMNLRCDAPDGVFRSRRLNTPSTLMAPLHAGDRTISAIKKVSTFTSRRRHHCMLGATPPANAIHGVFTHIAGGGYHSIGLREDGTIESGAATTTANAMHQTVCSHRSRLAFTSPSDSGRDGTI